MEKQESEIEKEWEKFKLHIKIEESAPYYSLCRAIFATAYTIGWYAGVIGTYDEINKKRESKNDMSTGPRLGI